MSTGYVSAFHLTPSGSPFQLCETYCTLSKIGKKNEQTAPVVLHTDQGTVYSSRAYQIAHAGYTIVRSMSRTGTPTDNPIIEALNGWIKEELYLDFNLKNTDDLRGTLDRFVDYFNRNRLAAALNYKALFNLSSNRASHNCFSSVYFPLTGSLIRRLFYYWDVPLPDTFLWDTLRLRARKIR